MWERQYEALTSLNNISCEQMIGEHLCNNTKDYNHMTFEKTHWAQEQLNQQRLNFSQSCPQGFDFKILSWQVSGSTKQWTSEFFLRFHDN